MRRQVLSMFAAGLVLITPQWAGGQARPTYEPATEGTRVLESSSGAVIKVLVEASNLGGDEVELSEITFPPSPAAAPRGHTHGRVEVLYILSGELDHVVNGVSHRLRTGMVGLVRPGDDVVHRVVSAEPVKALVVWAPGGEAARLAPSMRERPLPR